MSQYSLHHGTLFITATVVAVIGFVGTANLIAARPVCGDSVCEAPETAIVCPSDCAESQCPDGHNIGDRFTAPDGCNLCLCTENGMRCTSNSCQSPVPSGTLPADPTPTPTPTPTPAPAYPPATNSNPDPAPAYPSPTTPTPTPTPTPLPPQPLIHFPDVNPDTLEGTAANALANLGIVSGFGDGMFRGGQGVTRAEAAAFLLRARYGEIPVAVNLGQLPDVPEFAWYSDTVISANNFDILRGGPDGRMRPEDPVKTAEFITMMARTFDLPEGIAYNYPDVHPSAYFAPHVGTSQMYGFLPGRQREFQGDRLMSRGESVIAIYQMFVNFQKRTL